MRTLEGVRSERAVVLKASSGGEHHCRRLAFCAIHIRLAALSAAANLHLWELFVSRAHLRVLMYIREGAFLMSSIGAHSRASKPWFRSLVSSSNFVDDAGGGVVDWRRALVCG